MNNKRDIPGARIGGGYSKIGMMDLILLSIYRVIRKGEVCTFERLVEECFTNFPKVFGFKRYPEWPDSLKLDRPLRGLRQLGYITGGVRSFFSLTTVGDKKAATIEKYFKEIRFSLTTNSIKSGPPIGRSSEEKIINFLKESAQYKCFIAAPDSFNITETEIRKIIKCTLETPLADIKYTLAYYEKVAENYNDQELIKFLKTCSGVINKK